MEASHFEQRLRRPGVAEVRHERRALLRRVLDAAQVTIDDVVSSAEAKLAVRRFFHVADACEWEGRRRHLERRAAHERWVRENR